MSLLEKEGVLPLLENWTDKEIRLPAHLDDLEILYMMLRERKAKVVMEFGCGYSSLVIAKALEENRKEWDGNVRPFKTSNNFFTVFVVEANNDGRWATETAENIVARGYKNVSFTTCPLMVGTFRDRICHYYTKIPNILPDFIYLDGPDPAHANGNIRGIHFNHPEALPMAADLLFIEPILLPGTTILIDGRQANVRFLRHNFQRLWEYGYGEETDMSWMRLQERPLNEP